MMQLWRMNETFYNFRVSSKQFVGLSSQGSTLVADSSEPTYLQTFQIERKEDDKNRVRIRATNGLFLQVLCLQL